MAAKTGAAAAADQGDRITRGSGILPTEGVVGNDRVVVQPGVVPIQDWRPDPAPFPAVPVDTLGAVARTPG